MWVCEYVSVWVKPLIHPHTHTLTHALMPVPPRITDELNAARHAQQTANPGRARVCARRAAGWAVRAWYQAREGSGWGGDALKQLQRLGADSAVPEPVRQAAARLLTKVDLEHSLPFDDDPVEDAARVIAFVSA
jgi:hypothetical protein